MRQGGYTEVNKVFFHTHTISLSLSSPFCNYLLFCCCGQWQIRKETKGDRRYQVLLDGSLISTLISSILQVFGSAHWIEGYKEMSILFLHVFEPLKRKLIFSAYICFDQTIDSSSLLSHPFCYCRKKFINRVRNIFGLALSGHVI